MKALASLVLMIALTSPALACNGGVASKLMSSDNSGELQILAVLDPIAVSKPFGLGLVLCSKSGDETPFTIKVDAWMPRHQHGMNYEPTITSSPPDKFAISNMVFHMPGLWQLRVNVRNGENTKPATYLLDIEVK